MSQTPYPTRLTIELTNRCNRDCKECPRHKSAYPLGNMTEQLYDKILFQLPDTTMIVPFFRGESLSHPMFPEFMQKLSRFKTVQLATNGDLLTERNQTAVLTGCTFFSLSLHEFMMPWHTKATRFLHIARRKGLETQVSILESQVTVALKKRFLREWQKHVDRVRIYKEHSLRGLGDMDGEPRPAEPCAKPFNELVAYWDGKVGLCNHDWNNQTPLGNLNEDSLLHVWQNQRYSRVRVMHLAGKRQQIPSCKDCCFGNKLYGELYNADS